MAASSSSRPEPDRTSTPPATDEQSAKREHAPERTSAGAMWAGMILSALVLVLLLVFIIQNGATVAIYFVIWEIALPIGIALLFAAVAGILLVAIPGTSRMVQLRRATRNAPEGAASSSSRSGGQRR